jgi:hypothetical protein
MNTLTDEQAYSAMFHFLEGLYARTKSDDLGGFLGSMSPLADGSTTDPAIKKDWDEAVDFAIKGGKTPLLNLG